MVIDGYAWLWMVIHGYGWLWVVIHGYRWLYMVMGGYTWLWMVMYRLGHSKSDLTDIDTRGKITSPRRG